MEEGGHSAALRLSPAGGRFGQPVVGSIPTIVRSFKSAVACRINELRGTPGAVVWQRGYLERVIRDEGEMERVRRYMAENPLRWGARDDDG
jgi:putative transposase